MSTDHVPTFLMRMRDPLASVITEKRYTERKHAANCVTPIIRRYIQSNSYSVV